MRDDRAAFIVFAILYLTLMTWGIGKPWQLIHEDTGSIATGFARSHFKLGLARTKGHDFRVDRESGQVMAYAHHPPGSNLLLAAAMWVSARTDPVLVRLTAILWHSVSVILLCLLAAHYWGRQGAAWAALLLAVMPMSVFFGRYLEPHIFVLPAMIGFVLVYFSCLEVLSWRKVAVMAVMSAWAALMAWQVFFAMAACGGHAGMMYLVRRKPSYMAAAALIALWAAVLFAADVAHIYWAAGEDGLHRLSWGYGSATVTAAMHPWWQSAGHAFEFCRRYFTEVVLAAALWLFWRAGRAVLAGKGLGEDTQILLVFFAAGVLNLIVFPNRSRNHHYWPYALLPFMTLAFVDTMRWVRQSWPASYRRVSLCAVFLLVLSSSLTLYRRHTKIDGYAYREARAMERYH
ncbi:MAG: hypothetical protein AABZ44_10270 [Elusimicrobiota bacterium]